VTIAGLIAGPLGALAVAGCSEDPAEQGMVSVDPGSTYGAEVSLSVTGRGRVISTGGSSIDCPGRCFGRLVVEDRGAAKAPESVTLKAVPTPGARFLGWSFESADLATRGKGQDPCNPVTRPTITLSVDTRAEEITLPFGEVNGTAPAGAAGCASAYAVPNAYRVVAQFETTASLVEAGPRDAGGGDGGAAEVFSASFATGAVAREIGIAGGYVYWRWDGPSSYGVSYGSASGAFPSIVQQSATPITHFEVDPYGAVWQRSDNALYFVTAGSQSPTFISNAPTCAAVAIDASGVFCRTAGPNGAVLSWTTGGSGPTIQYSFVPSGADLVAESSYLFFSGDPGTLGGATIYYATRPGPGDGGTYVAAVTGRTAPTKLQSNGSRLAWIETGSGLGTVFTNSSRFSATNYAAIGPAAGLQFLALDPSTSYVWGASTSSIVRGYYAGSQQATFRTGLVGVGGIAVDSSNVYWTQSDGRVYRASRVGF
jgi:hypothetical protein